MKIYVAVICRKLRVEGIIINISKEGEKKTKRSGPLDWTSSATK